MTISIAHLAPVSVPKCPPWCVAHRLDDAGELVHLGETVQVRRSRSAATRSFELRLVAPGGARPGLLLDDVPVSSHALLSELERAARESRGRRLRSSR